MIVANGDDGSWAHRSPSKASCNGVLGCGFGHHADGASRSSSVVGPSFGDRGIRQRSAPTIRPSSAASSRRSGGSIVRSVGRDSWVANMFVDYMKHGRLPASVGDDNVVEAFDASKNPKVVTFSRRQPIEWQAPWEIRERSATIVNVPTPVISCSVSVPAQIGDAIQAAWKACVREGENYQNCWCCVIERCSGCEKHAKSTKHNHQRYERFAMEIAEWIGECFDFIHCRELPPLTPQKQMGLQPLRIGALEVFLVGPSEQPDRSHVVLHSKLLTRLWPCRKELFARLEDALPLSLHEVLRETRALVECPSWTVCEAESLLEKARRWNVQNWSPLAKFDVMIKEARRRLVDGRAAEAVGDGKALRRVVSRMAEIKCAGEGVDDAGLVDHWRFTLELQMPILALLERPRTLVEVDELLLTVESFSSSLPSPQRWKPVQELTQLGASARRCLAEVERSVGAQDEPAMRKALQRADQLRLADDCVLRLRTRCDLLNRVGELLCRDRYVAEIDRLLVEAKGLDLLTWKPLKELAKMGVLAHQSFDIGHQGEAAKDDDMLSKAVELGKAARLNDDTVYRWRMTLLSMSLSKGANLGLSGEDPITAASERSGAFEQESAMDLGDVADSKGVRVPSDDVKLPLQRSRAESKDLAPLSPSSSFSPHPRSPSGSPQRKCF
eukprot:TRINITY_DN74591_c0_g1_i1.p1 TRINITY_DN74591_c0_g1~~TRINITY_DN74591_c0_g1_i1.p1  ORF type:complete len:670 (-),score=110.04 TRINITY_DN74591_c0_g1_i1:81-2090(-)